MDSYQYSSSMEKLKLEEVDSRPVSVASSAQVVGSTELYENGMTKLIPMPTPDPKDPLNLPNWRKWMAVGAICFCRSKVMCLEVSTNAC